MEAEEVGGGGRWRREVEEGGGRAPQVPEAVELLLQREEEARVEVLTGEQEEGEQGEESGEG